MKNEPFSKACEILGGQSAMAEALNVSAGAVNQWVKGKKPFPDGRAPTVERLTDREVKAEELAPHVEWYVIEQRATESKAA